MFCDPSLEPSHRDGSNEGITTHVFADKYEKLPLNYPQYPFSSGALSKLQIRWGVDDDSDIFSLISSLIRNICFVGTYGNYSWTSMARTPLEP